jgi:uncharacterized protein
VSTDTLEAMIAVHVTAVTRLTHAALPGMLARGEGVVLTVCSVAGLVPTGSAPPYGATKAYGVSLTQALAAAYAHTGVRFCAVCPGFTRTEFHDRAAMDMRRLPAFAWLDADRVVRESLRDVARGTVVSIPSRRYRLLVAAARLLPRRLTATVVDRSDPRRRRA